jgi:hypothetical protein
MMAQLRALPRRGRRANCLPGPRRGRGFSAPSSQGPPGAGDPEPGHGRPMPATMPLMTCAPPCGRWANLAGHPAACARVHSELPHPVGGCSLRWTFGRFRRHAITLQLKLPTMLVDSCRPQLQHPWILPCGSRRQRRSLHRSLGVHLRAVRPDRAWLRQPSFLPVRSTRLPPGRARARPDPPPRPLRVGVVLAAGRSERLDLLTRAGSNSQSPGLGEKWPSALSPASCTRRLRRRGGHGHRHGRAQGSGHSGSAGTGLLRGSRKLSSRRAAWRGIGSAGAGQGEEQPWRIPTRA